MNAEQSEIIHISPLEREVAMRLLTSGPVSLERMARCLAVEPADVAAIMHDLEKEGLVTALCEDGTTKTGWILDGDVVVTLVVRVSPEQREAAMRLLTSGPADRDALAAVFGCETWQVDGIMHDLEKEGAVTSSYEDGTTETE